MADTDLNTGSGPIQARTLERSADVKTQVIALDIGGAAGPEKLVDDANPMPVSGPVTDAQLRATPFQIAMTAVGAEYWPGYSGSPDPSDLPLHVDPSGALITRGAVTTDEGTFRCNFANTSLAVSIGTVTVAGDIVTGTGFLAADVHYKDYFKLDADGESAWVGIDSVDSDTQMTLRIPYVGGSSGAASRALMRPVTGSGGSIAVASGQLTMTTGTTINAITRVVRDMDFAPLVYRARASFSQRIANQSFRIGGTEAYTVTDRWFARFLLDGTTNTTIKCESGRNPTTAPSASETETTTVTIPFGLTTATLLDYRVEQLTESCRFYINGVLVAEHTRAIPSQHDEMEMSVTCINGASAPASSTTVVVDYTTGKNHNKLEIGVMSDAERIVAAAAPLQPYNYNVAGVIAINTDILVISCSQLRSVSLQATSIGTTGRLDFFLTNDLSVTGTAQPAYPIGGGAGVTTTTAAGMFVIPTNGAAFLRVRMGVATTAGTTTVFATGSQDPVVNPAPTTQPVSGTGLGVVGAAAHDAAISGNPVRLAGRALTANYTAVASGDVADLITTLVGALVQKPYAIPESDWQYAAATGGIINTTDVAVKAAAAAGIRNYVTHINLSNNSATATEFVIKDGASTVLWRCQLPANAPNVDIAFPTPLRGSAATAVNVACITTAAAVFCNVQGYIAP